MLCRLLFGFGKAVKRVVIRKRQHGKLCLYGFPNQLCRTVRAVGRRAVRVEIYADDIHIPKLSLFKLVSIMPLTERDDAVR